MVFASWEESGCSAGLRGMRPLACRLGLFAARHRVQYIPFLVNHAQFQCLFAGRYNGETRFGAAEYGPFDGLHLAGERTGRIGDIVDVAACHAYVLEVVDVPADVHIHLCACAGWDRDVPAYPHVRSRPSGFRHRWDGVRQR